MKETEMSATTCRAIESCTAMIHAIDLMDARLAHEPSATTRGVRRELDRLSDGVLALRNFLQFTIDKLFRELPMEFTDAERRDFPLLLETIRKHHAVNWPVLAEKLAQIPGTSPSWESMPRDRLILAALAASGAPRFVIGTPETEGPSVLYDLYNLPSSVSAQAGLAPLVRAAIDGSVRFGQHFRFAKPSDQLLGSFQDVSEDEPEEV